MASDLISREALYKKILHLYEVDKKATGANAYDLCGMLIEDAPAVDAVEVVRCKDCAKRGVYAECPMCYKVWNDEDEKFCGYYETFDDTYDNFFCEKGVKKNAAD